MSSTSPEEFEQTLRETKINEAINKADSVDEIKLLMTKRTEEQNQQ